MSYVVMSEMRAPIYPPPAEDGDPRDADWPFAGEDADCCGPPPPPAGCGGLPDEVMIFFDARRRRDRRTHSSFARNKANETDAGPTSGGTNRDTSVARKKSVPR